MKFISPLLFSNLFFISLVLSFPNMLRGSEIIMKNNNQDIEQISVINNRKLGMPGGWNEVTDPNSDQRLMDIANWACDELYPKKRISTSIVSAEQQVVAGMNYRMIVNFYISHNNEATCKVYDIVVYDKFGSKQLQKSKMLDVSC